MVLDLRWSVGPDEESAERGVSEAEADDEEPRPRPAFAAGDGGGVIVHFAVQERRNMVAEVAACVELLHDVRQAARRVNRFQCA